MNDFDQIIAELPKPAVAGKLTLKILATNWGFSGSWDDFLKKAKASGYDGCEVWIPMVEGQRADFLAAAAKHGMSFGFLAGGGSADFAEHLKAYESQVRTAVAQKPLYVNTHAGRDYFTTAQNIQILNLGLQIGRESGVPVYCETHRGRCAFSANATREYMEKIPGLRLTADLSHWCVVHESLLEGYEETVAMALSRTDHIHARIGHSEGPQVNDPRAPEWDGAVKAHLKWWDAVLTQRAAAGATTQTILTEFGPPTYLPALPFTKQPVADQWDINVHMMKLLRERYA